MTDEFHRRFEALHEQAQRDIARARLELTDGPASLRERRVTLSSLHDEEEVSGLAQAFAEGARAATHLPSDHESASPPGVVEIRGPGGIRLRGASWVIIVVAVLLAALGSTGWLLFEHLTGKL